MDAWYGAQLAAYANVGQAVVWSGCATTSAKRERANEALGNDTREFIGPAVPPLAHIDKDLP